MDLGTIVGIALVLVIGVLLFSKRRKTGEALEEANAAPYKVEAPAVETAPVAEEPAKKERKPRAPKVGETAAKTAKAADKATKAPAKPRAPRKPKA